MNYIDNCKQVQTPCYIFDLDTFQNRIYKMQSIFGKKAQLCFAMKANPFLVRSASNAGIKIEVCSPGEFAICERNHVQMEQIVLSGVNKEKAEINRVLETYEGKGVYTVESLNQLSLLNENGCKIHVLLRLSAKNQFGMDEQTICEIIENRAQYPNVTIDGIQYYSGTQKKRLKTIQKELDHLDAFITELKDKYNYETKELEYGPGFYVPYFMNEEVDDIEKTCTDFLNMLEQMTFNGRITLEIGRYLAASCGSYYTKVVDEKENHEQKYVIVDGGIHQLNYYGQMMAMKIPHYHQIDATLSKEFDFESAKEVNVCGSLCTVNDILVKNLPLIEPLMDTILVFENCGAYSMTESMGLFLSRDLPRIYFYSHDKIQLIRDRLESNLWNGEVDKEK